MASRYFLNHVIPGMILDKAVLHPDGQVFLPEGTVLDEEHIDKLRKMGTNILGIREIPVRRKEPPPASFTRAYEYATALVRQAFLQMRYCKEMPFQAMKESMLPLIEPLIQSAGNIRHLDFIRQEEDYTFQHSVNVAILNGIIGKWMGLTPGELKELFLTGLLHDAGKTQIPLEILNKPARLNKKEMAAVKLHTAKGIALLQKADAHVSGGVLAGIAHHHERNDGSGYPRGLAAPDIHLYARITAVADVYDAMTSDRVYHKKGTPFSVAEVIHAEMFAKLATAICWAFLNNVRDGLTGATVLLNDGQKAKVICFGRPEGVRPIVKTSDGLFIDLDKNKSLSIAAVID